MTVNQEAIVSKLRIGATFTAFSLVAACAAPTMMPAGSLAPAVRQLSRSGGGTFTVAEYNVENLFDGQTVKLKGELVAKPDAAKRAVAKSLRDLNPDVVGLVEVESLPTLKKFRDDYLADMGYTNVVLIEGNDTRGIDVAVMSRFPIVGTRSHKDITFPVAGKAAPEKLSRDLLQTSIQLPSGYRFEFFVTHLKAITTDPKANAKREAEAQTVHSILAKVEKAAPNGNYAVVGDFNDLPNSPYLKPLLAPSPDLKLFDALSELGAKAFSFHPEEYRGRIDYILLSEGMKREYVSRSAKILDNETARSASDHLPTAVSFSDKDR
jgi:endonuclease/exonuclease/phosphatase family metal-dependent hydrolase